MVRGNTDAVKETVSFLLCAIPSIFENYLYELMKHGLSYNYTEEKIKVDVDLLSPRHIRESSISHL